ncbi:hypothetical protein GIB67_032782 [Kingdonia uniflora]|uniref:C3H1-type domain-containing protein n=1 Tax=Kingdonia uniflora TaxID=39325 RepID=A0A7J7MW78_9MAGN|nr:hypothetical protein GIB67_032782 [Kingdonia uniflora]
MPDDWKGQNNKVSISSNASADNLEEEMWNLNIQTPNDNNHDEVTVQPNPYPDRPGEPDCIFYLRTGLCGYGSNCRFNHPAYTGQVSQYRGELPERAGQPDCQYFLKTGTCKFGSTCKYNHPRDRQNAGQIPLNILGLPMRQEEKSCPYYMRTWSCKFGTACKFHHPQPPAVGAVLPIAGSSYGSAVSSVGTRSNLPYVGGLQTWSLQRGAPSGSGPLMQSSPTYMPVVLPAQQGWNTYLGTMSPISSTATNALGSNIVYNSKHQGDSGSGVTSVAQYPERPEQPECQYFMRNGSCKFGPTCKYHHPKERIAPLVTSSVGPFGLPLRPGQAICTSYSNYGVCRFGSSCKFDHPLTGLYNYGMTLPALSIMDPPNFSYQRNTSVSQSSETALSSTKHENPDTNSLEPPESASPEHKTNSPGDQHD